MPKGAIALAAFFIALAGWQAVSALSPEAPPPIPDPAPTPLVSTPAPAPSTTELEPLPRVPGPAPNAEQYGTVEEIGAQLEAEGLRCTSLEHLDQPNSTLKDFALCDMGDATRRIDIFLFADTQNRDLWLPGMKKIDLVAGPNWIITGAGDPETIPERLKSIRNVLGGELRL